MWGVRGAWHVVRFRKLVLVACSILTTVVLCPYVVRAQFWKPTPSHLDLFVFSFF